MDKRKKTNLNILHCVIYLWNCWRKFYQRLPQKVHVMRCCKPDHKQVSSSLCPLSWKLTCVLSVSTPTSSEKANPLRGSNVIITNPAHTSNLKFLFLVCQLPQSLVLCGKQRSWPRRALPVSLQLSLCCVGVTVLPKLPWVYCPMEILSVGAMTAPEIGIWKKCT